ncbi:cation-translocating P-type ATPase [Veillonella parvula]|uniref:heavy metal translocating P-type ATPase n=1 Tax=Veillonella parvula TaxID=29466 RepID=UPI002900978A|nr:cation-translocating P-type ATPase [Veillonella parvula]MDU1168181.1 cation-translocating P-type ATPase [Veillonella parvula]MDU2441448.1 cation-translocating P-type ATPase [Veillonella sp.]
MVHRIHDILSGLYMTILAGLFLLLDGIPHLIEEFGGQRPFQNIFPFEPSWITVIICGFPLVYLSIRRIVYNKGISKISSALLISMAMFAAIAIGDIFAAGEVAFIMALGALLEEATTERAKKGLKKLISLAPVKGRKIQDNKEMMVPVESIQSGDYLRILPGETIPVDGRIINGETTVDQSIMTGESIPVDKIIDDDVFGGTINCFGAIDIIATKVGEDSSIQKMIQLIKNAEQKQAPIQRIADIVASRLVPIALMIACIGYLITGNIIVGVTVLVVFCPCALVLATPTAVMAAIGQATKHGVIIKSGEILETMGKVDTMAFDKTGTLTRGQLAVQSILAVDTDYSETDILQLVASAEAKSEHPIGKAIVSHAIEQDLEILDTTSFTMFVGKGIIAVIKGRELYCGNERFLEEHNIIVSESIQQAINVYRSEGKVSVIIADREHIIGIITLSDTMRNDVINMISAISSLDMTTVLLTGDSEEAATYIGKKSGVSEIHAELLPGEKVSIIESLQGKHHKVCMVGDGINDAPAMKIADVSIAMGTIGSDIAIETADIALMSDDLSKIPYIKRLSDATIKTIKFSIALSMVINCIAIILSLLEVLTPTTGALVHNVGSCLVVLIAARLYDRKFI